MKITASKSVMDMLDAFNDRIHQLESGLEASFDYPDDLEDLENGEYESHMAEPIEGAEGESLTEMFDNFIDGITSDPLTKEVLKYFSGTIGLDIKDREVQNYADAVAEYIKMAREALGRDYSLAQWYEETSKNYPEELEGLPKLVDSCDKIISSEYGDIDHDRLWEIAEQYNSSIPVSGDWDTETQHEQQTISDELGVSMDEAKNIMIDELGFDESMF